MKESGIGRENGIEAFEACQLQKVSYTPPLNVSICTRRYADKVDYHQHCHDGGDARGAGLVCGDRGAQAIWLGGAGSTFGFRSTFYFNLSSQVSGT